MLTSIKGPICSMIGSAPDITEMLDDLEENICSGIIIQDFIPWIDELNVTDLFRHG